MSSSYGRRFIFIGESHLLSVGEIVDLMLSSHDLIPNDVTMKVRMMMMQRMLKSSSGEEHKNFKC